MAIFAVLEELAESLRLKNVARATFKTDLKGIGIGEV
jgi:hypothetical protein